MCPLPAQNRHQRAADPTTSAWNRGSSGSSHSRFCGSSPFSWTNASNRRISAWPYASNSGGSFDSHAALSRSGPMTCSQSTRNWARKEKRLHVPARRTVGVARDAVARRHEVDHVEALQLLQPPLLRDVPRRAAVLLQRPRVRLRAVAHPRGVQRLERGDRDLLVPPLLSAPPPRPPVLQRVEQLLGLFLQARPRPVPGIPVQSHPSPPIIEPEKSWNGRAPPRTARRVGSTRG